jgi:hypothetical protein
MLKSISNPMKFPDMSEELVRNFTSIRIRAEALLSQRVAYLAMQNAELLRQVKSKRASGLWKLPIRGLIFSSPYRWPERR